MTTSVREDRLLVHRELRARELMDDPDCDPAALARTYRHFRVINGLVSRWRRVYTSRLRPLLSPTAPTSLLDIGCGGGDVPRALARWAAREGLLLEITAIDPDARAAAFAAAEPPVAGLTFARTTSSELVRAGARFDIVTSNHLLHHLDPAELRTMLADSEALSRRLVVHNDIARSPVAYGAYLVGTLPWRRSRPDASFIHDDGLLSIRRSYRRGELAAAVPPGWRVVRQRPYRLLLVRRAAARPRDEAGGRA
ncbi:2-polyprenyl-3-methyl-5-hydroxy-6-metoxy-1,4-benzoquinol methylase [Sanguibacter gelidistatuariae]|uniref:2-polyprenyl-3-methyl-5-hydroxy-6-metoxy-1,4-benzoquinol methylase n=1 Tax=Sanguibacter gelidistatuariae TaxID=1814289 RepID=A0A1G6J8H1_9MICO|nr:methyltransferase domain-containing protein [Sanguibacter gelidistatuariae]SDC15144.1 2-polyprenyl-3-methyl-5-hydroxy-6-metoxy-1,4-benzoquinol methylase [Sanguibacter gelidistatuariae]